MSQNQSRRKFFGNALKAASIVPLTTTFGQGFENALQKRSMDSKPSDLKITEVQCAFIRNGHGLFVKIKTNQDIYGCGEGVDAVPGTYHFVKMMEQRLK